MGVISHNRNTLPTTGHVVTSNDIILVDYLIESPQSTDVEEDLLESGDDNNHSEIFDNIRRLNALSVTPRRRRVKFGAPRLPNVKSCALSGANKRHWGSRRMRRFENSRGSGLEFDPEDVCEDLSDMLSDTMSTFSQLFIEKDKMKVWNEFVHKSEEEQNEILCGRKDDAEKPNATFDPSKASCSRDIESAFSPFKLSSEKCYRKIDKSCRFLLVHKPCIWDKLGQIENDLRQYFAENPQGCFLNQAESGFDRLLLHAAAQYLDLKSISFTDESGRRKTKVLNLKTGFRTPCQTLVGYLEDSQKFKESIQAVVVLS